MILCNPSSINHNQSTIMPILDAATNAADGCWLIFNWGTNNCDDCSIRKAEKNVSLGSLEATVK